MQGILRLKLISYFVFGKSERRYQIPGISFFFVLILCFGPCIRNVLAAPLIAPQPNRYPSETSCSSLLTEYLDNQRAASDLINPVLFDKSQIEMAIAKILKFQDCINQLPEDAVSAPLKNLYLYSQYFIAFAQDNGADSTGSQLELIDLATVDDPAIKLLRESIKLPPPAGLIFVRHYSSRGAMPVLIQSAFRDPQVAGVTIFAKYIAILDNHSNSWAEQALNDISQANIFSHELVHAYVNGVKWNSDSIRKPDFPTWFDEGLATYLSNSGKPHSIITPNFNITQTTTQDYLNYQDLFQYLEAKQGRQKLYKAINVSVLGGDVGLLYKSYDIPNEAWLNSLAQDWHTKRIHQRTTFGIALLGFTAIAVFLLLPEYQCTCGYSGSKRSFKFSKCPVCGRPVEESHLQITDNRVPVIDSCQICKKRFWPWQRDRLDAYERWVRVWIKNPNGAAEPIPRFVRKICDECQERSERLKSEFLQYIDTQTPILFTLYTHQIRTWVDSAPFLLNPVAPDQEIVPVELVVENLAHAVLKETFGTWISEESELKFAREEFKEQSDDLSSLNLSNIYEDVIQSKDNTRIGSLYNLAPGKLIIHWRSVD